MPAVKKLVLDVLKPHHPNALEFATSIAALDSTYKVRVIVEEVDEKTESILVEITGDSIHYELVAEAIGGMGGSVHSVDEVEVIG